MHATNIKKQKETQVKYLNYLYYNFHIIIKYDLFANQIIT